MISPDLPIASASEDALNRSTFAKSLAKTISQSSLASSFTIGLYGAWGRGKTSLLNMVLEEVANQNSDIAVLRFNPWLCTDPQQLITQFFKQLSSAIRLKKPKAEAAWALIDQYADLFDAAALIPVAGSAIALSGKSLFSVAKKRLKSKSSDLQARKDQIIKKLADEKQKIIVAIDDIDRLSEAEIVAVFQLVKSLADFPNTVYLLAFDYDVVTHALSTVQHGDGKAYLEKIVQVPFEVPAPDMGSIHNALFDKLNSIISDIPDDRWDTVAWGKLFQFGLRNYILSIRDVIRYTNVFLLKYGLLKDETDPVDLLGLTALQVFEPSIYSKLPAYKSDLCGASRSYAPEPDKERVKQAIAALLPEGGNVADPESAGNILCLLFPKAGDAFSPSSYHSYRAYSHRDFLIRHNIAEPACFDRYFALALEHDAVPASTLRRLIYEASESEFSEILMQIYREGKLVRLLEELEAYANRDNPFISGERASLIVTLLARNWAYFDVDDTGFLSVPFQWRLLFCTVPLLRSMNQAARMVCIRGIFEDAGVQVSTIALLLRKFENELGRYTENAPEDDTLFTSDEVTALEKIFTRRAADALDSRLALTQHHGLDFLWLLGDVDAALLESRKTQLVADDASLIKLIGHCMSHGSVIADKASKTWDINRDALGAFIDVEEAYRRVKARIGTSWFLTLSKEEQWDAVAFVIALERPAASTILESHITSDAIEDALETWAAPPSENN